MTSTRDAEPAPPKGVDREIDQLREQLQKEFGRNHADLRRIVPAFNALVRAVAAQHRMTPVDAQALLDQLIAESRARAADLIGDDDV